MDGLGAEVTGTASRAPSAPLASPELVSTLFRDHYAALCRTARLLVDDAGRAEELVQDAFMRTLASPRGLRRPDAALAYIRRAVVHACHSELRRRRVERRIGVGPRSESLDSAGTVAAETHDARFVERVGEREEVLRLLRALPARRREAVVLRYYADLDEASIAEAMNCSLGAVKSQLSKAREQLSVLSRRDREER